MFTSSIRMIPLLERTLNFCPTSTQNRKKWEDSRSIWCPIIFLTQSLYSTLMEDALSVTKYTSLRLKKGKAITIARDVNSIIKIQFCGKSKFIIVWFVSIGMALIDSRKTSSKITSHLLTWSWTRKMTSKDLKSWSNKSLSKEWWF